MELGSWARLSLPVSPSADGTCHTWARLPGWDTHHWAGPYLRHAGLSAMAGEMPGGGGRACAELVWVIAAGSLRWPAATRAGFVTSAPPRQQVQTGGEGGSLCWVRGGICSQEGGPFQPRLLGACPLWCGCWGNLLVKLSCVSP